MEKIIKEFEDYMKELVMSYPKATAHHMIKPSDLLSIGAKSREVNQKIELKINELTTVNSDVPAINIRTELAPIRVQYYSQIMI